MSVMTQRAGGGGGVVERAPGGGSSSLADVVALILDKGLVIDVFVRVSLVGIEILTIDARIVVASTTPTCGFAEATDPARPVREGRDGLPGLVQSVTEGGAKGERPRGSSRLRPRPWETCWRVGVRSAKSRARRPVRQRPRERDE